MKLPTVGQIVNRFKSIQKLIEKKNENKCVFVRISFHFIFFYSEFVMQRGVANLLVSKFRPRTLIKQLGFICVMRWSFRASLQNCLLTCIQRSFITYYLELVLDMVRRQLVSSNNSYQATTHIDFKKKRQLISSVAILFAVI